MEIFITILKIVDLSRYIMLNIKKMKKYTGFGLGEKHEKGN